MQKRFACLLAIFMMAITAHAFATTSTIDPTVPPGPVNPDLPCTVPGNCAALDSSQVRDNFLAAYNDINNIYGLLSPFGTGAAGLVPASGGRGSTYFLNAAGGWAIPDAPGGSANNLQANNGSGGLAPYPGITCPSNRWLNALDANGTNTSLDCAQINFSNLAGAASNAQIPAPTVGGLGGILALASSTAHEVVQYIDTSGIQQLVQLGFSDLSGILSSAQLPQFTGGDVTTASSGSAALTLNTVNSNTGTFGSATQAPVITLDGKGRVTAASNVTATPAWSNITGTPTTRAGYGITDALSNTSTIAAGGPIGGAATVPVLTYNATGQLTAVSTASITPSAIGAPTTSGTGASGTWGISISGNAATATALASAPSQCTGGQFATGVAPSGNANCGTPAAGISGPGTTTSGYVPLWNNTTGTLLAAGLLVGTTGNNTILETNGSGLIASGVVPTLNQNTTGTAANITATTNSTLTTLSSLALPYSQLTGAPATGVSSVSGTSGQVSVSPTTGAVVVSLLSTITQAENFTGGLQSGGNAVLTAVPPTSTIYLGTSASATNPQRSGEASTGLYSLNPGELDFGANVSGTPTQEGKFTSAGLTLNNPLAVASGGTAYSFPNFYAALQNVQNNTGNAVICVAGDSTAFGVGSNGSTITTGGQNYPALSWPTQLANIIQNEYGYPAQWNAFEGDGISGNANFGNSDSRIVADSNWSNSVDYVTVGTSTLKTTTLNDAATVTPAGNNPNSTDAYIDYVINGAEGTITAQLGSGTPVAVNAATGTANTVGTIHVTATDGLNAASIKMTAGSQIHIQGVRFVENGVGHGWVQVVNMSAPGSTSANWNSSTYGFSPSNSSAYSALGCSLVIIPLVINDYDNGTGVTAFTNNIQGMINAAKAANADVLLSTSLPTNPSGHASLATQLQYTNALRSLALSNNLRIDDSASRWVSYAVSSTMPFYYYADTFTHGNKRGYENIAHAIATLIMPANVTSFWNLSTTNIPQSPNATSFMAGLTNGVLTGTYWTGADNTAIGASALNVATTGTDNSAVGFNALQALTTGSNNTAAGSLALEYNITGSGNTAVGFGSGRQVTTSNNTSVGIYSLYTEASGTNNTAIGSAAAENQNGASDNTAVGQAAMLSNTTGQQNTAMGFQALKSNSTGNYDIAIGSNTGSNNEAGQYNVLVGVSTDTYSSSTQNAVGIGAQTKPGTNDIAIGIQALNSNGGDNNYNVAVGYQALYHNTTGTNNVAIGEDADVHGTTGQYNIVLGGFALSTATTDTGDIAIGSSSMQNQNGGNHNVGIGTQTLQVDTTGSNNVAIGYQVGDTVLTTGSNNILIGTSNATTTAGASDTYEIAIGGVGLGTDTTAIGTNGTTTAATVYGNLSIPSGTATLGKANTTLGILALEGSTSGAVTVEPAATAGTWTLTLPTSGGTSGYVLSTNGSGVTSWVTQSGSSSTLGTSASATSPNRSSEAATGFYSLNAGELDIGINVSGTPTLEGKYTSSGFAANVNSSTVEAGPSATTAVSLSQRFKRWIDVSEYGAVANNSTSDCTAVQTAINDNQNATIYFPKELGSGIYHLPCAITLVNASGDNFQGNLISDGATVDFSGAGGASTDTDAAMKNGFQVYPVTNSSGGDVTGWNASNANGGKVEGFVMDCPSHGACFRFGNSIDLDFERNTFSGGRYGIAGEASIGITINKNIFLNQINAGVGMLESGNSSIWYGSSPSSTYWNDDYVITNNSFSSTAAGGLSFILDGGSQSERIRYIAGNHFFSASTSDIQYGYISRSAQPMVLSNWFENINYPVRMIASNSNEGSSTTTLAGVTGAEPSGTWQIGTLPDGFSFGGAYEGNYFQEGKVDLDVSGVTGGMVRIADNVTNGCQSGGYHIQSNQGGKILLDQGDQIISGSCSYMNNNFGGLLSLGGLTNDTSGNLVANTLNVNSARKGTFVCTSGGSITVSNTNVQATSDILITLNAVGGTISTAPAVSTKTAGSNFHAKCATSDTATYNYDILN